MDDSAEILPVALGGKTILVETRVDGDSDPEARVSIADKLPFDGVADSIEAISTSIVSALRNAAPDKATVEFGVDVGVEAGQLTSLLVKGSGTATIKVTLEWEKAK